MYKIAGSVKYPYGSISTSDTTKHGLGFATRELAQSHADMMNKMLLTFDSDSAWNKEFWKMRPEPWVAFEVVN